MITPPGFGEGKSWVEAVLGTLQGAGRCRGHAHSSARHTAGVSGMGNMKSDFTVV